MEHTIPKNDRVFFISMTLMVVLYAWLALSGAIFGIFHAPVIWCAWAIISAILWYTKILSFPHPSKEICAIMIITTALVLLTVYYTVPTVFGGRDQGSLAEAAMQLATHHTLTHHTPESDAFFSIYGRGQALNFPGFHYIPDGSLLTQFPLPYISFMAGFYGTLGLHGLIVGNALLLFIFMIAIAIVARLLLDRMSTYIFFLTICTSFTIFWFAKFTLSENLAGALLWAGIALLLINARTPDHTAYFTLLATIALLLFSRIEGLWFFCILCALILIYKPVRSFVLKDLWNTIFVPLAILMAYGILITIMNMPFLITMAKAFLDSPTASTITSSFIDKLSWLFTVYGIYGILIPSIISVCAIALVLRKKISWHSVVPLIIVLPLFVYYLFPHISSDHPWMLRRFSYALVPATILTSITVTSYLSKQKSAIYKRIAYAIPTLIIMCNIPAFLYFFTYAENKNLLSSTADIVKNMNQQDLILVDSNATGSGWSMITTPLRTIYGLHAAYLFNPADVARLPRSNFTRTLLIVPYEKEHLYKAELSHIMHPVDTYTITTNQLDLTNSKLFPARFPRKDHITVSGTIYELK